MHFRDKGQGTKDKGHHLQRWITGFNFLHPEEMIYRVYPTLWDGNGCTGQTVYAIDRKPAAIPTECSSRPRADPASTWDSPTFQRILPPTNGCWSVNAVTWATLPAWISYIQTLGYTLAENTLAKLKPYGDLYVIGP